MTAPPLQALVNMAFAIVLFALLPTVLAVQQPKNVLFIPVDDLRPELFEAYNQQYMYTPNLDKLARESFVFQRAYCQHAVCIPSRNSFMTGRRPDTTQVWSGIGNHDFRQTGPNWITLPQHFKENGFTTLGGGKTFHPGSPPDWDEPKSWSQDQPYFAFKGVHCPKLKNGAGVSGEVTGSDTWCPLDEKEYPDSFHYDWKLANHTLETLKFVNKKGNPWFVAAGFRRPHVPWMMPKRYWDMYNATQIPSVLHRKRPVNSPDLAYHNQGVFLNNNGTKYLPMPHPFPVEIQQDVRHAYMASISWVDSQIGRVLQALDTMGLTNDTLVVLFGDHGYQLGEHDSWHKQTNWELAARVPLIIRAPWKQASLGKSSYALVELVDLYRTIADLVGAPKPGDGVEGTSFAALFDNPNLGSYEAAMVTNKSAAAFSQYPRCPRSMTAQWDNNTCSKSSKMVYMGYSMRTPEWRYTAWMPWDMTSRRALWNKEPYAVELYDHSGPAAVENDFNQSEVANVAQDHPDIVDELHQQLKTFFDKTPK